MNEHIPGPTRGASLQSAERSHDGGDHRRDGRTAIQRFEEAGGQRLSLTQNQGRQRDALLRRSPAQPFYEATVTSKGQVTLPKELRERLRIGEGDKVRFTAESGCPDCAGAGRATVFAICLEFSVNHGAAATLDEMDEAVQSSRCRAICCGQKDDRPRHECDPGRLFIEDDIARRAKPGSLWPRDCTRRRRALSIVSLCASLSGSCQAVHDYRRGEIAPTSSKSCFQAAI